MSPRQRALPAPRQTQVALLPLTYPREPMVHFDHALILSMELMNGLSLRCSPEARHVLGEYLRYISCVWQGKDSGYWPPKERPFTPAEQAAHRELCGWCGNIPSPPWPEPRVIPTDQALATLQALLACEPSSLDRAQALQHAGACSAQEETTHEMTTSTPRPVPLVRSFDGHPITVVEWKGRQIFFVDEIAAALGYSEARHLRTAIQRNWTEEAEEGEEFLLLTNGDIRTMERLRRAAGSDSDELSPSLPNDDLETLGQGKGGGGARKLLVLTESGVNLVCIKTEKPAGRALRRWLAREVLPSIRQTGAYQQPASAPVSPSASSPSPQPTLRERLAMTRQMNAATNRLFKEGLISRKDWAMRLIDAQELATGRDHSQMRADIERQCEIERSLEGKKTKASWGYEPPTMARPQPPTQPLTRPSSPWPQVTAETLDRFAEAWIAEDGGQMRCCAGLLELAERTGLLDRKPPYKSERAKLSVLGKMLMRHVGQTMGGKVLQRWMDRHTHRGLFGLEG